MFRIDVESNTYDLVANIVSTVIGVGAASLVGAFCTNIMDGGQYTNGEYSRMKLGRTGIKLVTLNTISNETRKNLDDLARGWNAIVDTLDGQAPVEPEVVVEG